MTDLDRMWSEMLEEAMNAARASGRGDVADYLDLKARNDAMRRTSVRWLLESITELAADANRELEVITIDREDPHNFPHLGANIVGTLMKLRYGVRCLTVEAGWTRTPTDGFMRGGALAIAKISHFGIAKMNVELALKPASDVPVWIATYQDGSSIEVDPEFLRSHFAIFIGSERTVV